LIRKIFSADMRLFFKGTPPHQRDTYLRHRLVRDIESAVPCHVTREEQPTGQPLIYRVEMVADCSLRNLFAQRVRVVEQG
jgi:hypothetical protein